MITAKGLEERLREMRVWTRFQKNLKNVRGLTFKKWSKPFTKTHKSYSSAVLGGFIFEKTPEGSDYWRNIANKIDEVEL